MNKEEFYNKISCQGFIDVGEAFEGSSNLDDDFSDYIEKIFHPWNLCRSFGYLYDSGAIKMSHENSTIDILCYKTIRYIDVQGDTITEKERKLSQNKNEIDSYTQRELAVFVRQDYPDNYTKFLGVYKVDESLSMKKGFFVFVKISNRLYLSRLQQL